MWCDQCGKELPDNADFCAECGAKMTKSPNHSDETDMFNVGEDSLKDVPVSSKKKSTVIVSFIAVAVLAVLLVALLVKIFKGDGPAEKLVNSTLKTVANGSEFTVTVKIGDDSVKYSGFINVNSKEELIQLYLEEKGEDKSDKRAFSIDGNQFGVYSYNAVWDYESAAQQKLEIDEEVFYQFIKDISKKDFKKLDFEYYLDEMDLLDYIEDYVEPKDIDNAVEAVLKALDKNAEDCLGFEKDGDTYSYDIDVYDTIIVCLEAVEKYAADEDDYEDLMDFVDDNKKDLKDISNIEFEVTFDGKYISEIEAEFDGVKVSVALENVGKCEEELDKDITDAIKGKDSDDEDDKDSAIAVPMD